MIIILSIILSIIATILLVGQYYKIAADYKYYIADKAFYKYKNDVPFQKNVNRRKELKTYELIHSNTYELNFPLIGKKATNGSTSETSCIGLSDYGNKLQECSRRTRTDVFRKSTDKTAIVKTQASKKVKSNTHTKEISSVQVSDPLLIKEEQNRYTTV